MGWRWTSFKALLDRLAAHTTAEKQAILVSDEWLDHERGIATGDPQIVLVGGHLNSGGTVSGGDASGRMPVVEENSNYIKTYLV